jgi:hypothetical protein
MVDAAPRGSPPVRHVLAPSINAARKLIQPFEYATLKSDQLRDGTNEKDQRLFFGLTQTATALQLF